MRVTDVIVELPGDVERRLCEESHDIGAAIREGFLVNLFRRGLVSHLDLGQSLGLDRFATNALLKRHDVTEQSLTHAEIDAEVASLREAFRDRSR